LFQGAVVLQARIYQEAKTAMQSGRAKSHTWILTFIEEPSALKDPLMGWPSTVHTQGQVRLLFKTVEGACAYARRYGFAVEVINQPQPFRPAQRSYSDNFRFDRPLD
jgi:hypothetical protein